MPKFFAENRLEGRDGFELYDLVDKKDYTKESLTKIDNEIRRRNFGRADILVKRLRGRESSDIVDIVASNNNGDASTNVGANDGRVGAKQQRLASTPGPSRRNGGKHISSESVENSDDHTPFSIFIGRLLYIE